MRKLILGLAFCLMAGISHAGWNINVSTGNQWKILKPDYEIATDFYFSSVTASINNVECSTITYGRSLLHALAVTAAGSGDSWVEVFDAGYTTQPAAGAIKVYSRISGSTTYYWPIEVFCSSGIAVSIQGTVAPQVTVIGQDKR